MEKRLILFVSVSLLTLWARAQWTAQDSLNLSRILNGDGELKLNRKAIERIDFGHATSKPLMSLDKDWLNPDATLPTVQSTPKPKFLPTLKPYTANTPFNWDPIFRRKIYVAKDTWRGIPVLTPAMDFSKGFLPTNWAKNPMAAGLRKSWQEIRSSGINYQIMGERANGVMVNTMTMNPVNAIPVGKSGVTISGGTVAGLDLMGPFTKDFWDKKGKKRRARTLEVLRSYGDSTSVLINHPVEQKNR